MVKAVDFYKRAFNAEVAGMMPPADMFWGDRYGELVDPFGVSWAFNQTGASK